MKNIEKLAPQIAKLIADDVDNPCGIFSKLQFDDGTYSCDACPLTNKCCQEKDLLKWLLSDDKETEAKVKHNLRPCYVKGRKALFHRWEDKSEILAPSPMVGGHRGGELRCTIGIVEYDDGSVHECYPYEITFIDKPADMKNAW